MKLTIEEILKATEGTLVGENTLFTAVSTDSRKINNGDLFVALRGEKFDGHNFVSQVAQAGAAAVMVEEKCDCSIPQLVVKDTRIALGKLAGYYLEKIKVPVVGITGSTGKTTTKDMIASVLSTKLNTLKTQGNFNNDIGLPLTVFGLEPEHQVAVLEMGMNHFGEIEYLSKIAKPDVSVITNVGVSHIENLGSREGILKAKCEIFSGQSETGLKVLNADDDMLKTVRVANSCFFSVSEKTDIYASDIQPKGLEGINCTIHTPQGSFCAEIPVPGNHMISNAMAATAVGLHFGLSLEEIAQGIKCFKPTAMRMAVVQTPKYTIIDDAYNANPNSVKAAIDVVKQSEGFKCAILGDMLELGDFSRQMHEEVGEYAKELDLIIAVGELAQYIYAKTGENAVYFSEQQALYDVLDKTDIIPAGATVLVKASRGMHFEKIVERLKVN